MKKVLVNAVCPGAVSTGLNHFLKGLGVVQSGTDEVFGLVTDRDGSETRTFTYTEGTRIW